MCWNTVLLLAKKILSCFLFFFFFSIMVIICNGNCRSSVRICQKQTIRKCKMGHLLCWILCCICPQMFTSAAEKHLCGNRLNQQHIHLFSLTTCLNRLSLQPHSSSIRSLLSFFFLLLWLFSLRRLLPPRQEVVGDQGCEEVCSHACVSSYHQTQRLRQHKQTEHVDGCPVVQLHAIVLCGFHHSKKIHQCHRRVEGQLHHVAWDQDAPSHWKAFGFNMCRCVGK